MCMDSEEYWQQIKLYYVITNNNIIILEIDLMCIYLL